MALIKCPECGHEISDKSGRCIYCGYPLDSITCQNDTIEETIAKNTNDTVAVSANDGIDTYVVNSQIDNTRKSGKKKFFIAFIVIVSVALTLGITIGIPVSVNNAYLYAEKGLTCFSNENREEIGKKLDSIPYGYRDVETLKTKYGRIMSNVNIIENVNEDTINDEMAQRCRDAYISLLAINDEYYDVDVYSYLKTVPMKKLFYGYSWSCSSGKFQLHDNANGGCWLNVSLPNNKEEDKEYYYFEDKRISSYLYGYENKNDKNDWFYAFEITKVVINADGKMSLTLICKSNGDTYTLK